MKFFQGILITGSLFYTTFVSAALPPMAKEELEKNSKQIVSGTVTAVQCRGATKERDCSYSTPYVATLKVTKVLKGKKMEELKLLFSATRFKKGCTGGTDTIHHEGESGKYYLNCSEQGCILTNYDGVEYQKQSTKPLPTCD